MAKKILLVEDSDTTRLTHRVMIARRTDYEIIAVANGAEALKLAATHKPDLVLMDVMMPGMDGLEVCRRMRKEPATSRIPIVLLTFRIGEESVSSDSLLQVINDILDFSKIEAGKLELDPVSFKLRQIIQDALKSLSIRTAQKGLELACRVETNVPDDLFGDPVRLRQVILNLVGNALKFTERGEIVVQVRIDSITAEDLTLHFSIRDTGVGIPREKLGTIFESFTQADGSMSRKHGGTGLGLTISTRLVGMMGGKIWVESEPGRGSTFHFTSGFRLLDSRENRAEPAVALSWQGLPVLVVDDHETNRRILFEMLQHWGMKPTLAESGKAALVALQATENTPGALPLILIDAHMPEMDGCPDRTDRLDACIPAILHHHAHVRRPAHRRTPLPGIGPGGLRDEANRTIRIARCHLRRPAAHCWLEEH
jgi:CheY-like chemotaxis protein